MSATIAVYAALSIQSCVMFWAKATLETFTFTVSYSLRDAYKQFVRFQSHQVNTAPFENVENSPLKLTNEKIRLERYAELYGFKFIWRCIV